MDNFFHNINKRLNDIDSRQDIAESAVSEIAHDTGKKLLSKGERSGLAKQARAGKDIGKPGKMFKKVAGDAAKRYGSKEAGERVAAAAMFKNAAKHESISSTSGTLEEGHCPTCDCSPCSCNEGNAFSGAVAKAKADGIQKGEKIRVGGKTYPVKEADPMGMEEGAFKNLDIERQEREMKKARHSSLKQVPGVQNLKPGAKEHPLKNVAKGIKAFVTGKEEPMDEAKAKPDYIDLDHDGDKKETMKKAAADKKRSTGTAFDPEARKQMKTDREGTGNFDKKKISTGTVYTRRHKEDDDEEVTSDQPKKKGRPKGPAKGPERVTAKAWKHKGGRTVKEMEIPLINRGEYDQEGDEVKGDMHTVIRHAQELEKHLRDSENLPTWIIEKVGQIKGMMTSISDYMLSQHERNAEHETGQEGIRIAEKITKNTPTGEVIHDFVHSKNPKFAGKSKKERINQALGASYGMKKSKMEEESTAEKDDRAEHAGKKVAKDIEYDDKKDKNWTAERKAAAKKKGEWEPKVDETTTSGSVAPVANAAPKAKGMSFGKGVYEGAIAESFDKKLSSVLNEGMNVSLNMNAEGQKSINVSADGDDAEKLAEILKLAGMGGHAGCSSCGESPCGCDTVEEAYGDTTANENHPDWPTDTETVDADDPHLRRFSGGLNGPKSTGQTTIPVIAGQRRRMSTMEENVTLERSLFKLYKDYKGQ